MTSRDFCYWLQGYLEVSTAGGPGAMPALTSHQVECVGRHLALVFKHEIDPSAGDAAHQAVLNETHAPPVAASHGPIGGVDPVTGLTFRC